jgi:glycosyltransferase involved in cell wall biosynthesis
LVTIFNANWGPASSRNAGIQVAKSDVIVSLDCDMICPPTFLESHMDWFHKTAKISVIGLRKFVKADGIRKEDIIRDFQVVTSLPEICSISNIMIGSRRDKRILELEHLSHNPFPGNCFHGSNMAYWRDDAIDVGCGMKILTAIMAMEMEFDQRLFENGARLVFENGATAYDREQLYFI